MSNFFEDLIKKRQEELKNTSSRENDNASQSNINAKVNLIDLIKKVQEEKNKSIVRLPKRTENNIQNNSNYTTNNNLNKVTAETNLNNNVPKTKEDIDKMVSSIRNYNVNSNIKENEFNNIKNFNNQVYPQQQFSEVKNKTNFKISDVRNNTSLLKGLFKMPESFADNLDLFDDGYNFGDITRTGLRYVGDTAGAVLGTVGDATLGATKGVANIAGNVVDLIGGGVAGIADLTGNKDFASKLRQSIASGSGHYASNTIGDWQKAIDKYSAIGNKGDEITENLGYMGALGALGGPGGKLGKRLSNGAMFVSGAGGALNEAYQKGATGGQAVAKAIGGGLIETFTENLFGLFGNADTKVINNVVGKLKSGLAKTFARAGLNASGEASEELISYSLNHIWDRAIDWASNGKGIKFAEDWNWDEVIDSAATAGISALLSGGFSSISNTVNNKTVNNTWTDAINKTSDQQAKFAQSEELNDELENLNKKLKKTTDTAKVQEIQDEIKWKSKQLNALTNNNLVDVINENISENSRNNTDDIENKTKYSIAGTNGMENAIKQDTNYLQLERNYNKAQQMQKLGIDNETIRQNTNWFKDKNGDWKFEFSDKDMALKENVKLEKNKTYKLGQILEHDTLFEIYPELANYDVTTLPISNANGSFNNKNKKITISNKLINNNKLTEGTLIHEVQHAIQNIEKFEGGKKADKSKLAYYNSLGEIEASNTKDRFVREKYNNENMENVPPESSKSNPKHKNLDNYLKNRNALDKVKDSIYNYFSNKNGGRSNEVNQEMDYTDKGHNISLVDKRYRILNNNTLPIQNFVYEKSDNVKIDTLRKDANKYFNNTYIAHNFVNMLEKIISDKDIEIRLNPNLKTEDGIVANGSYSNGVITINPNSNKAGEFIAIHELTHTIGTKQMLNIVDNYRKANTEFNASVETLLKNYKVSEITEEALSDVAGQLFGNQEFINNLSQKNPNLFKKIYNEIKYLWHQFRGYKNQNQFINDLHYKWEQAYRKNGELNNNTNYSIKESENNSGSLNLYNKQNIDNKGRFLSKGQQNYFNNSKVRDNNNNLKTLYHGTPYNFNIFNYNKLGENTSSLGAGFYFTDSENTGKEYARENGNVKEVYVNIEKPLNYGNTTMTKDEYRNFINKVNEETNGTYLEDYGNIENALIEYDYGGDDIDLVSAVHNASGLSWERIYNILKDTTGFDGIISEEGFLNKGETIYVAFNSNQIKNVNNVNPTSNLDIRYSLPTKQWSQYLEDNFKSSDTITNLNEVKLPTKEYFQNKNISNNVVNENINNTKSSIKNEELKSKAQDYIKRSNNMFINNIVDKFQTSYYANKNILNNTIDNLIYDIRKDGSISTNKANEVFNELYSKMVKIDTDYYDMYKNVKDEIRKTRFYVSDNVKNSITDFNDFRNSNMGVLNLTNNSQNIDIDTKYKELSARYPELFPESVVNEADQLKRIAEVSKDIAKVETNVEAYLDSTMGKEYKDWARNDFNKILDKFTEDVNMAYRYNDDVKAEESKIENVSTNDLIDIYNQREMFKNEYEKVLNKEVLTKKDSIQVERLLNEEISIDELPKTVNKDGILKVYNAKRPYYILNDYINKYKKQLNADRYDIANNLIKNTDSWKDKKSGLLYSRETARRNIYDIMPKADADKIYKTYFEPYSVHEAEATRDINNYNKMIEDLDIGTAKKYKLGNEKVSESALVQMFGEGRISLDVLKETGVDAQKIENATKVFRQIYDELFEKLNKSSVENGYNPIQKKKDYFPHFTETKPDTFLSKIASKVGIDLTNQELPTDIAGITAQFKPGRKWMGNLLHRYSDITDFDALKGFDNYVRNATDIIYHTDDIKNLRALNNAIRYNYSDDGIKEKINSIKEDSSLDDLDKATQIQELFENKDASHLSKFVTWLNEYTNGLAGKKSMADRNWEYNLGRNIYSTMANLESRVSANMIAGNVSVALTNFGPLAQAKGEISSTNLLNGVWSTLKNAVKKDNSFANNSTFITNRRGTDYLKQGNFDKVVEKITKPLNLVDDLISESIVRAKYYENLENGMMQEDALKNADEYTASLMADRSKGQLPLVFNSKNPIAKLNTMFQVEVNNQWSYYFKDLPRNISEGKFAKAKLVGAYTKIAIGSYLFNELVNSIRGGDNRVLPDPINIIMELVKGLGNDDDKDDWETMLSAGKEIVGNLPFISFPAALLGVEDLGRIPVSGAVPNIGSVAQSTYGLLSGSMNSDKAKDNIGKELKKPLYYLLPPALGGQSKKTVEAIETMNKGGSYSTDKDGNKVLQFPVEDLNVGQKIKAGLFGKYALPTANTYSERGYKSLNAKQTKLYEDTKLPYKQLLDYIDAGLTKTSDKIKYVNSNNLTTEQKWGIYNYNIFSNSTRSDGSSQASDAEYITKNGVSKSEYLKLYDKAITSGISMPTADEYKEFNNLGISLEDYINYKIKYKGSEIKDSKKISLLLDSDYSNTNIQKIYEKYLGGDDNTEYNIMKSSGMNIKEYLKYKQQKFESDKKDDGTVSGKSVSGSKKKKVYEYVNSMNISYNQRLLLLGQQYKLTDEERGKLAKYVNSMKLSKEEKLKIYGKLQGFTVYKNGTVKW